MSRMAQTLVRLAAFAAGGLLASLIASVLAASVDMYFGEPVQSVWSFTYFGVPVQSAWFLPLGALVGITSGAGLELTTRAPRTLAERGHLGLWAWVIAAGLGIVSGGLLAPQPPWSSTGVIAVVASLALALVNGLAAGSDARRGAFGRSLVAIALSLVAGIAFAAVSGAVVILTFHPCPPHAYCLEPPPVGLAFVGLATYALPVALWLGLASWLGLGLGLMLHPHTWQEA